MRQYPFSLRSSLIALAAAVPVLTGVAIAQVAIAQADKPPVPPVAAAEQAKPAETVVARVDGAPITEADLAIAAEDPALALPGMNEAQKRDLLIGYLVDLRLGAKAAEAANVGQGEEFARRLAYFRDKLLLDAFLEEAVAQSVTDEAARKLYEDTVKTMTTEEEVRARHILVETEDEAKAVHARIKAGEDFAAVAADKSKDPGSKTDGGDLGFFTKDRMVAPFSEAAFRLAPGEISAPVKSQFGWHVIRVEEKRSKPIPAFDEMREQIDNFLARKAQQELILSLREKAKVERVGQPAAEPKPQ